jgi:glutathione S-transferase
MKVFDYKGYPNPLRVRIALAEKGLSDKVEFVSVDVPNGGHRKPEFLEVNPDGLVPALQLEDGTVLSECTAITEYLDHASGDPELTGTSAKERGVIHMIQRRIEAGLLDAVGAYFHMATPGLGPNIETYENKSWGENRRDLAVKTMRWLDGHLASRDFVAANRFTVADITAFAGLAFAGYAGIEIPEGCEALKAWQARINARETVQAAAA